MSSHLILLFFLFFFYNLRNLFCLCGYKLTQFLSFEHQSLENCGITSHCRGWGKNVIIQCLQFGPRAQITPCIRHSMCACVYACMRTHVRAHGYTCKLVILHLQSYIVHSPEAEANVYYTFCMDNKQS